MLEGGTSILTAKCGNNCSRMREGSDGKWNLVSHWKKLGGVFEKRAIRREVKPGAGPLGFEKHKIFWRRFDRGKTGKGYEDNTQDEPGRRKVPSPDDSRSAELGCDLEKD